MLVLADDGLSVTPKWADKTLDCQMHGVVLIDGYIYGTAQSTPSLVCLELKTGKVMWTTAEDRPGRRGLRRRDAVRLFGKRRNASGQTRPGGFRAGEPVYRLRRN